MNEANGIVFDDNSYKLKLETAKKEQQKSASSKSGAAGSNS